MIDCNICTFIKNKRNLLYEDELVYAMLPEKPITLGHIFVVPKKHYPIIEQVPDYEIAPLFKIANKLSSVLFETLKIQGTNMIIQNGIAAGQKHAHFIINIIPRKENDNLKLEWKPKQLSEEEMSTAELKLKDQTHNIGGFIKENYLIKQLHRIP